MGLTGAPVLAEFRKHQLDCRLHPQIRIFDQAILAITPVSRRDDAEQFPAPRLLFLSPQEPVFENLQFHHAQCPLDAQHQLIVHRGQIVDVIRIRDQCPKYLAQFQQVAPIFIRSGEPRHLDAQHNAHFS